jgi:methyl coenzyme M reductase gamma subunit
MKGLHEELVRVRMQQFAHTDLTYYNPSTMAFKGHDYAMMFKGYDYAALLNKLPQIEELIRAVERSVNAEITKQEAASSQHGLVVPMPPPGSKETL